MEQDTTTTTSSLERRKSSAERITAMNAKLPDLELAFQSSINYIDVIN